MSRNRFRLGKVFGIPLYIDASWLLIFIWVTWSLARGYFPSQYPQWPTWLVWLLGIITSLFFYGSVLLPELGHSLVARGQGTPVRDITLFIFGGMAEITEEPDTPGKELVMALAGPMASLALSAIFAALFLVTRRISQPIAALGFYIGQANLALGLFNLIPGFPLDGGRVLRAILWGIRKNLYWATRWASRVGQGVAYLFILGGIWLAFGGNLRNGLWFIFIGLFLDSAAHSAYAQLSLRHLLDGHQVGEVMSRECYLLPPQLTLDVLVEQHLLASGRRCFSVGDQNGVLGLITIHNVRAVPKNDWPYTHVRDILTPLDQLRVVSPETPLWTALQEMTAEGVNQLPIVSDGTLIGMVSRDSLLTFIRNRSELGL